MVGGCAFADDQANGGDDAICGFCSFFIFCLCVDRVNISVFNVVGGDDPFGIDWAVTFVVSNCAFSGVGFIS